MQTLYRQGKKVPGRWRYLLRVTLHVKDRSRVRIQDDWILDQGSFKTVLCISPKSPEKDLSKIPQVLMERPYWLSWATLVPPQKGRGVIRNLHASPFPFLEDDLCQEGFGIAIPEHFSLPLSAFSPHYTFGPSALTFSRVWKMFFKPYRLITGTNMLLSVMPLHR